MSNNGASKYHRIIIIILLLMFVSCAEIDKDKFQNLYNDITSIKGHLKLGIEDEKLNNLLQKYSTDIERIDSNALKIKELELYHLFSFYLQIFVDEREIQQIVTEFTPDKFPSSLIILPRYPIPKDVLKSPKDLSRKDRISRLVFEYDLPIYKVSWIAPNTNKEKSIFDGACNLSLDTLGRLHVYEKEFYKAINRNESSKIILKRANDIYKMIIELYNK